jgi:sporulation protein YlmC with PRC-barrel domain
MNRLLACTAVGLVLGFSPALAEPQNPADQAQTPPAMQDPAQPSGAMPAEPMEPAAPMPGESSQSNDVPGQSSQMTPSIPDETTPPAAQSSQAPGSAMPAHRAENAVAESPKFLSKQESTDLLASNLIGQSVYNSQDESIGDINDLVTDENGKVVAVLVGTGGFLGLGEKDVALGFKDLRFTRTEDGNIKVIANVTQETLASAPDYQTLAEQKVTVGENKGDREDRSE